MGNLRSHCWLHGRNNVDWLTVLRHHFPHGSSLSSPANFRMFLARQSCWELLLRRVKEGVPVANLLAVIESALVQGHVHLTGLRIVVAGCLKLCHVFGVLER